jgi:thiol-disulfide isomerase/thioredoxin
MSRRDIVVLVAVSLAAALLGLAVSVMRYGPGPMARTPLGRWIDSVRESTAPGLGAPVPRWSLAGLDGSEVALPPPGRPVLINYWASWCGPCLSEMPMLAAFAAKQGANGLQVVGIAQEDARDARAFLAHRPSGYPHAVELPGPEDSGVRLGNVRGVLPYTVLIDAEGRLRARRAGAFRDAADLEAWVEAAGVHTGPR